MATTMTPSATFTSSGQTFTLGERVRLRRRPSHVDHPGAYGEGIYRVTWIGHGGNYVSLRWSPRPDRTGRGGLGASLDYLDRLGYEIVKLRCRTRKDRNSGAQDGSEQARR